MIERLSVFLLVFCMFTVIPFSITYILKWNCKAEEAKAVANRFFSRKWMITIFPCILVILIIGENMIPEAERHYLLQWAILISMTYVVCDNIKSFVNHFISIKVKKGDWDVELQPKQINNNELQNEQLDLFCKK